jgi:hypothetical protein
MISIGEHYRGPEHKTSRINAALWQVGESLDRLRSKDYKNGDTPWVNPIFIVGGSLGEPDFDWNRMGYYDKKNKGVVVELAIPSAVAQEKNLRDPIVEALHSANAAAFHFFEEKGLVFPLREAEAMVAQVAADLAEFA